MSRHCPPRLRTRKAAQKSITRTQSSHSETPQYVQDRHKAVISPMCAAMLYYHQCIYITENESASTRYTLSIALLAVHCLVCCCIPNAGFEVAGLWCWLLPFVLCRAQLSSACHLLPYLLSYTQQHSLSHPCIPPFCCYHCCHHGSARAPLPYCRRSRSPPACSPAPARQLCARHVTSTANGRTST